MIIFLVTNNTIIGLKNNITTKLYTYNKNIDEKSYSDTISLANPSQTHNTV